MSAGSQAAARRRDRIVYLAAHPVLFPLLAAFRSRPVLRLGRTVVVNSAQACRSALTGLELDRSAVGTTGGAARALLDRSGRVLFDQDGADHRLARRRVHHALGTAGVARIRPRWTMLLERRLAPLARGCRVDVVELAAELSGTAACALLGVSADPLLVARTARDVGAAAVRAHLPGPRKAGAQAAARAAADRLLSLLDDPTGLAGMLVVAAVNTTVAGIPRAVAWCADADLWSAAADEARLAALADELLRVVSPTPLLPRVAAQAGSVGGCPVSAGDRLLLVTRHAVGAHERDPAVDQPAPGWISGLVFGAGPHTCPGAGIARAQLVDTLRALAPYRPVVARSRPDRHAALPGWRSLLIEAAAR